MGIRALPPEHFFVLRGEIMLSSRAMGRLSPEEWRPIFASGLIYYKSLQRDMLVGLLKTMIPIVLLMPFVLVFSFKYLEGSFLIYPIILALIGATLLVGKRLLMVPRNLWFKADVEAAHLVGKELLLESLRRIDEIDPKRTGKRRRGPAIPSPSDRIERLTRTIPLG
jgi:Zn-dependent protease with chaperone function